MRYHDFRGADRQDSNPDFLEFHFSYKDLEIDPATVFTAPVPTRPSRATARTCSPATSCSTWPRPTTTHWERSIAELQRVVDTTREPAAVVHRPGADRTRS